MATFKGTLADLQRMGADISHVGPSVQVPTEKATTTRRAAAAPPRVPTQAGGVQVLQLPGWLPTSVNRLLGGRTRGGIIARHKLKQADVAHIGVAATLHGARKATGPRRVDIHLVQPKGRRRIDADNCWKVTKDGLKHAGLLLDDTPRLCRDGDVTYSKALDGGWWGTWLVLTDVE